MEPDFQTIFNCFVSVGTCFLLSVAYVASLHVWNSPFRRDHPSTIKKKFISVFFMLFIAPCFLYLGINKEILEKVSFLEIMGLRTEGLCQAFFLPLFLTMILFLGPISMELFSGLTTVSKGEQSSRYSNVTDLMWIRNHVVAPFSEEFTYRSCMVPLLLQCLPPMTAVLSSPLLFGISHLHHMQERIKFGMDFYTALQISCFHVIYTTIFGAYSAYIFYRTGHFLSIFVVHAFCNFMGFPDVIEVVSYKRGKQIFISTIFVIGFAAWCYLVKPLTDPAWYHNKPTWYEV